MDSSASSNTPSKKLTIIGVLLIGVLILLIGAVFFYQQNLSTEVRNNIRNTDTSNSVDPESIARIPATKVQKVNIPPLNISRYIFNSSSPQIPSTLSSYSFKTNYSLEEVAQMARVLGLTEKDNTTDERYSTYYNLTSSQNKGYLVFDRVTGSFVFQSYGVFQNSEVTKNQDPLTAATSIARQIGYDDTVICNNTYQRPEYPDYVYIECHRDWARTGLPILGVPGILSVNPSISTSTLSTQNASTTITRNNDFNTLTIVLSSSTNRVVELRSNLRKIKEKVTHTAGVDILSPEIIKEQFNTNKAFLSLSVPAGASTEQGLIPWNKIYQGTTARADSATVTDFVLTYLENPGSTAQESLTPYYLIRGTAELTTGYTVNFTQAISALNTQVAGVAFPTVNDRTQKQGTIIEPTLTAAPTPQNLPSPTPITEPVAGCVRPSDATELNFSIPGLGNLQFYYKDTYFDAREIYLKSQSIPFETINKTRELLYVGNQQALGPIAQQYLIFAARELTTPQYIQPKQTPPSSIAEAKAFFKKLSESAGTGPYGRMNGISTNKCINAIRNSLKAPPVLEGITDCSPNGWYDLPLLHALTDKTAAALVTAVQNNTLNTLAAQQDLFPPSIITDFEQLLYTTTDTTTGVGELIKQQLACRVTGSSPKIFIYKPSGQSVDIMLDAPLTYYYPAFSSKNTWSFTPHPVDEVVSNMYYEYNPEKIIFTLPSTGFIISRENIKQSITELGHRLTLTIEEQKALVQEVQNALLDYNKEYSYIQISIASQAEINTQLPLKVSPQPDSVTRVHLLLKPLTRHISLPEPTLPSFTRSEYTVIEIGARLVK